MDSLYREKKRLLMPVGALGGWVTVDPGRITLNPDTRGVYKALRIAEVVQTGPNVVLIRARFQSVFSSCLVVRGTTETGVKVRVGVQLDSGELQRLERVLWAAGFHVINQVARFSMRAALAHVED